MATKQTDEANSNLSRMLSQGRNISASSVVSHKPDLAALISKLRASNNPIEKEIERSRGSYYQNRGQIERVSNDIRSSVKDNENIMRLFPDLWLAEQILVSSILSPKDMFQDTITFKPKESIFPSSVQASINTIVDSYFTDYYDFQLQASEIISNALFRKGAHVKVILPENILDEIINGQSSFAVENFSGLFSLSDDKEVIVSKGFLGDPPSSVYKKGSISWAIEQASNATAPNISYTRTSLYYDKEAIVPGLVEVVDNFDLLKLPKINEARFKSIAAESISASSSDRFKPRDSKAGAKDKLSSNEFKSIVFKNNGLSTQAMVTIPTPDNAGRRSVSRPLVIDAPNECCIPVTRPGSPQKAVGAFFLIDIDGNFVTKNSVNGATDTLSSLISGSSQNASMGSVLLEKAKNNLVKSDKPVSVEHMTRFYSSIIEQNLIEKLRNGRYHSTLDVHLTQDVGEIMLARTLSDKFTRILYIPQELFTYFAFEYDDNGIGKSYLDEVKMLTSIRGILLFAKVMGLVKNSINTSSVKIKLDPRDPDPESHIEQSMDLIFQMRQQYFPLGINSMPDLADWVTRAGLEIGFEGHPSVPDVGFDFENKKADHNLPDSDLDELLRDHTFMRFGITSEMIDGASQAEFATTVQQNNILFSRRIRVLQRKFCSDASDFVQKVMRYDPVLKKDILALLKDNLVSIIEKLDDEAKELANKDPDEFVEHFYDLFVSNTEVILPAPDEIKTKTDKELIDNQSEAYDAIIEYFINSEFAPAEVLGEWAGNIDMLKSAFKALLMRKWASNNNILPEVFEIISDDEDGKPQLNISEEYSKLFTGLAKSYIDFLKRFKPLKLSTALDMARIDKAGQVIEQDMEQGDQEDQLDGDMTNIDADQQQEPLEGEQEGGEDETPDAAQ